MIVVHILVWDVTQRFLVEVYRSFRRTYCLHPHGRNVIPARSREMDAYIVHVPLLLLVSLLLHVARMRGAYLNIIPSPLQDIPKIVDTATETR